MSINPFNFSRYFTDEVVAVVVVANTHDTYRRTDRGIDYDRMLLIEVTVYVDVTQESLVLKS
jgi:hypothetical protein